MAPLVLYRFPPSGPSRVATLVVRNLNLDVEIRNVNIWEKEQLKDDYIKVNPQHCVPTIDDDGFILWESRAIATYLIEKHHPEGHALYPLDIKQRAVINRLLQFDVGTLYPSIHRIFAPALFQGETKISDDKRQKLHETLEILNSFLEGNQYVAGSDGPTLADLSIVVSVTNIVNMGGDINKYKNIAAWFERCKTLPGFDENNDGSKIIAERVLSRLVDRL